MRILFCSRYIDSILYFFLQRIAAAVKVDILCSSENEWTARLAQDGQRVSLLAPNSRFDRSFRDEVARRYSASRWDLLHCFHGNAELANLIQWAHGRIPIIAYRAYIGHLSFRENPAMYWSVRHPNLAAVVAVSRSVKDYLEGFRFLRPPNVHVINHGIDYEWLRSQTREPYGLRQRLGVGDDTLIVASLSNIRPYKRVDLVVRAAEILADRPIHFVHVGDDRGWCRKAEKLPNIDFLGYRRSPWRILSEADVFATTAHNEAFGRSNLEALACGKPLIGSDTGGLLDLIEDGVNGRLFKSKNARDFAAKVSFYERDRDAVQRHSENAVKVVKRRFSVEVMAERYLALYSSVLGSVGGRCASRAASTVLH